MLDGPCDELLLILLFLLLVTDQLVREPFISHPHHVDLLLVILCQGDRLVGKRTD